MATPPFRRPLGTWSVSQGSVDGCNSDTEVHILAREIWGIGWEGGGDNTSYPGVNSSRAYFKPGETYHVVGVWDGGNHFGSLRIYINGVCVGMDRGNIALSSITQMSDAAGLSLVAGNDGAAARYGIDAEYHLLRLHNRPLSDTEIRQSYLGQKIPYKHSNASTTELIGEQTNRDFSSGIGDWSHTGSGSSLTVTSGELVRVQAGGHTTFRGEGLNGFAHRMWLNWASDTGGGAAGRFTERVHQVSFDAYHTGDNKARLYVHDNNEAYGVGTEKYVDITTTKTRYTVEFAPLHNSYAASGQYIIFGLANPGTFKLDNISYTAAGCYMDLNSDGVTDGYWMDSTTNGNNANVSGAESINYELPILKINPTNAASDVAVLDVPGTTRLSGTNYTFATGTNNFFNYREWRVNTGSAGGAIIRNDGSGGISLNSGSGTGIFIDSGNNVGIGGTPNHQLDIVKTNTSSTGGTNVVAAAITGTITHSSAGSINSHAINTGLSRSILFDGNQSGDSGNAEIRHHINGHSSGHSSMSFHTYQHGVGYYERMRITYDGKVRIGTGNTSGTCKFEVTSDGVVSWGNNADQGNLTWNSGNALVGALSGNNLGFFANGNWASYGLTLNTAGDLYPNTDNGQDLGSSSKRWANLHVGDVQLNNEGSGGNEIDGTEGKWTIQEGEEDLFIVNRKSGKKYKFKLEEVE